MGFWDRLTGTEESPAVQQAAAALEGRLPEGWHFDGVKQQLFCRRPVKLSVVAATAVGPDGQHVLALTTQEQDEGAPAVRALADAVGGTLTPTPRWAPPRIEPREADRESWPLVEPESDEERQARDEALGLLPEGSRPMNVDHEPFGSLVVYGVVAQLPDRLGTAGVGLNRVEAWTALAERLRGDLAESTVWIPSH